MLLGDINFDKTCFEIGHDFLSELMEYIADGIDKARYDGNLSNDDLALSCDELWKRGIKVDAPFSNPNALKK